MGLVSKNEGEADRRHRAGTPLASVLVLSDRSVRALAGAVMAAVLGGACTEETTHGESAPQAEASPSGGASASGGVGQELPPPGVPDDPTSCSERPPPNGAVAVGEMVEAGGAANGPEGLGGAGAGVCGCSGKLYPNEEAALQAEQAIDQYAYCRVPEDEFGCGPERCKLGTEACGAVISHAHCCEPEGWTCIPVDLECLASMDDPD